MQRVRRRVWLIGLLIGWSACCRLAAQCPDRPATLFTGALRTTATSGCVPLLVETSNTMIGVQNVRHIFEYDKKNPATPVPATTHTYTKPGIYYLVEYSEKETLMMMSCAEVWVYDTLPPKVDLMACGTRASLTITDPLVFPFQYDTFVVRWGDGQTDTVQANNPGKDHVYLNTDPRRIQVQGIHKYGNCGGSTSLSFTPNQPAIVQAVEKSGDQSVRILIQNPTGLALTLQQRPPGGVFQGGQPVPAGASPVVEVAADTGRTCYRVVPGNTCPGYAPSPEVCFTLTAPKPVPTGKTYTFPDAFSPNRDGLNDEFGPVGGVSSGAYQLTIFDRWGSVLFLTTDQKRFWDGSANGQPVPVGVYSYEVKFEIAGGQTRQQSGRLQLMR